MLLTVIIIGRNAKRYIQNCLESILDQSLSSEIYEVIYVDNHSKDESVEIVSQHFPEVHVIANDENIGFYRGFNLAAEQTASGDYLVALPQDTILHYKALENLLQAATTEPNMMVGLVNTINPNATEFSARDRYKMPKQVYWCSTNRFGQTNLTGRPFNKANFEILAYSGVAAIIRKDAKEKLHGYFDDRLSHLVGDSELGIRANVLGYRCLLIPSAVVYHIEDNKRFTDIQYLWRTFKGARDSIIIYFKLMTFFEFLIFSPMLFIGLASKVFTLRFPGWQKTLLCILAILLSPLTFGVALLRFPQFAQSRQGILKSRDNDRFWLLKTIIQQKLD